MPETRRARRFLFLLPVLSVLACFALGWGLGDSDFLHKPFQEWSLDQAIQILTDSPWVRQEIYTRVLQGVGSGRRGEKEIYYTFFVRLLSAEPVRLAYARVQQIQQGYDRLEKQERQELDAKLAPGVGMDVEDWVILTVSYGSTDPDQTSRVLRYLATQTTETMRHRASLSTEHVSRLEPEAYFAPRGDGVGAKFVFPRRVNGVPVVTPEDEMFRFNLGVPGEDLRAIFSVPELVMEGRLVL